MAWSTNYVEQTAFVQDLLLRIDRVKRVLVPATVHTPTKPTDLELLTAWTQRYGDPTITEFGKLQWYSVASEEIINEYIQVNYPQTLAPAPTTGWYVISDTTLLADSANPIGNALGVANIPQTYKHLYVMFTSKTTTAAATAVPTLAFNDTALSDLYVGSINQTAVSGQASLGVASQPITTLGSGGSMRPNDFGVFSMIIMNYTSTTPKSGIVFMNATSIAVAAQCFNGMGVVNIAAAAAIDRIKFTPVAATSWKAGTRLTIWGFK